MDWTSAEAQVAKLASGGGAPVGKSTVVSVKANATAAPRSGEKRKAGDLDGAGGTGINSTGGEKKKTRRGKSAKGNR